MRPPTSNIADISSNNVNNTDSAGLPHIFQAYLLHKYVLNPLLHRDKSYDYSTAPTDLEARAGRDSALTPLFTNTVNRISLPALQMTVKVFCDSDLEFWCTYYIVGSKPKKNWNEFRKVYRHVGLNVDHDVG